MFKSSLKIKIWFLRIYALKPILSVKAIFFTFILFLIICTNCNGKLASNQENAIAEHVVIDSILVKKSGRKMIVFSKQKEIKTYQIALGNEPVGKKQFEGDGKTPEGLYFIDAKSAKSKFHKNLNISYPNKEDIKYAATQNKKAGGDIKIHGLPNGFSVKTYVISNWTLGCIAVTNDEIDELFEHIKLGSPILILP